LKDFIEGRMEGKKTRGRTRIGMIDELMEGTYGQMKRKEERRTELVGEIGHHGPHGIMRAHIMMRMI